MNAYPTDLKRQDNRTLLIVWSDGLQQRIDVKRLRDSCPCANCRASSQADPDEQQGLRILTPAETRPLDIEIMHPVGNYAYNIHFTDGHTTGIFTFPHLRKLGK